MFIEGEKILIQDSKVAHRRAHPHAAVSIGMEAIDAMMCDGYRSIEMVILSVAAVIG
jgi:hypothetical protein